MAIRNKRIIDQLDEFFGVTEGDSYKLVSYNSLQLGKIDDIMQDCFLARQVKDKNQFLFFGENIIKSIGAGNQSQIENLVFSNDHELTKKFQETLNGEQPIIDEGFFINEDNLEVRYRQKLYPLLNEEGELEYIFGGIRWKIII